MAGPKVDQSFGLHVDCTLSAFAPLPHIFPTHGFM